VNLLELRTHKPAGAFVEAYENAASLFEDLYLVQYGFRFFIEGSIDVRHDCKDHCVPIAQFVDMYALTRLLEVLM
jgi:hypothetical protein